jgi:3-oxoacyl-(acyl-carrier-protein) synthase/NAD(P)-dependent dehydrogenase (short-subunit alcohol dehydrogenase family)/SAM-dependent methyltransferase/acyl carrier protein
VAPDSQPQTFARLADWVPADRIHALSSAGAERFFEQVRDSGIKRIIYVSLTDWRSGVDDNSILGFFRMIKALSKAVQLRLDILTVNSVASPAAPVTHPVDAVYIGLGQTLAREFLHWEVRCVSMTAFTRSELAAALQSELPGSASAVIISEGCCWMRRIAPVRMAEHPGHRGFRQGGTYMIVGATGGIGGALAGYIAHAYRATLILTGRRAEAPDLIRNIERLGGRAIYEQLDLSDEDATRAVLERYEDINGIIHSALVLDDALLINMTEDSLMSVLHPKVHGTINLANAIRGRELDFVLFFSSIQSHVSNPGQGNYTAASVCEDAVAALLRDAWMVNAKIINWGFWGSIGIVASDPYRERMKRLEIGSIEAAEGISVIEQFLKSPAEQITVIKGSDRALTRMDIETDRRPAEVLEDRATIAGLTAEETGPTLVPAGQPSETGRASRLKYLILPLDTTSPEVCRNRAASAALQQYARMRLARTTIPSRVAAKFSRLVKALADIPPSDGPSRTEFLRDFPEMAAHVNLLDKCIDHYPEILSGSADPLEIMFPGGSFSLVEPIYRDNPIADYFNRVVARIVNEFISHSRLPRLRLLEIGAGTGSTTQFVLPVLQNRDAVYTFTDVSHAFLNKARHRFADYEFVKYEIHDMEKPDRRAETYDLVIATNVIHATADIEATLENVHRLIAPGGIFVLNEITAVQDFATLTFGLTDGWWLNSDSHRIPNSPLLTGSTWHSLLARAGFDALDYHGTEEQQVIVAGVAQHSVAASTEAPEIKPKSLEQAMMSQQAALPKAEPGLVFLLEPVQAYISRVVSEVMQVSEKIDVHQPFRDYGIDSLIALELLKPFRNDLGPLPATVLFEHPTVAKLAAYFLDRFGAALAGVTGGPAQAAPNQQEPVSAVVGDQQAKASVAAFLRGVIAQTMMMEVEHVEDEVPFREYGIDSLISLELLKPVREIFGPLPATLMFEYPSVARLSAYLAANKKEGVRALTAPPNGGANHPAAVLSDSPGPAARAPEISPRDEDIAIIGISGQFPQADDVHEFWRNLSEGRVCTTEIPTKRWPMTHFYVPGAATLTGGSYTNVGGFVADIDAFDHEFFSITPFEAQRIDPQERLFLQNVYSGILDAGYSKAALKGKEVGVFVGVMNGGYAWHRPKDKEDGVPTSLFWSIANRTSYVFDWKGPSMAIDTACSSSLTALHAACQGVHARDCDIAIVGGVNLIVHPRQYELLCSMHMLSKSDRCKPFGENADGFVDGEGICCIVVKRYADAVRDRDRIYGVVRGTAINAGGQANGYSAPSPAGQARVIEKAIQRAGIEPAKISYVEAHGTGTELGDPIEISGLSSAFALVPAGSIAIGSVKGNIGHLESAAGLAGVIKVLLQLENRTITPSLHAVRENPHLKLSQTPFRIEKTLRHLEQTGTLFASVSSFGAGGANAHVVIQSAPVRQGIIRSGAPRLIHVAVLSSRTGRGLQRQVDSLRQWLLGHDANMEALSYILCCGRDHFTCRTGYVFETKDELLHLLRLDLPGSVRNKPHMIQDTQLAAVLNAGRGLDRERAQLLVDAFTAGSDVPWSQWMEPRNVITLPGYSFEKKRFWVDSDESCFHEPDDIVRQHVILGRSMAPAAWTLSRCLQEQRASVLKNVLWSNVIETVEDVVLQTRGTKFLLTSIDGATVYCEGVFEDALSRNTPLQSGLVTDSGDFIEGEEIYRRFDERGYCYGSDLRVLRWAKLTNSQVKACVDPPHDWGFKVSPGLIEGGLQAAILTPELQNFTREDEILVPYHLGELRVHCIPRDEAIYCHCHLKKASSADRIVTFDVHFVNVRNELLVSLTDLMSVAAGKMALRGQRTRPTGRSQAAERVPEKVAVYEID